MTNAGTAAAWEHRTLRVVMIGNVDAGKSSIIGMLLAAHGQISEEKLARLQAAADRRGVPFEYTSLTDGLQAERDQNVTIDTTEVRLRSGEGDVIFIDAPGHLSFLRNMVTGASRADAAVLVVDATEGVTEQTQRHAFLLTILGISRITVAINKVDMTRTAHLKEIAVSASALLASVGLKATTTVNISAKTGFGIGNLLDAITGPFPHERPAPDGAPVLPVQDVYRVGTSRVVVGRAEGAPFTSGAEVVVLPQGARGTLDVDTGTSWYTLREPLFVTRGDVIASPDAGLAISTTLHARVFWLGREPLGPNRRYDIRIATQRADAELIAIRRVIDGGTLADRPDLSSVSANDVADVEFKLSRPLVIGRTDQFRRVVIVDSGYVAGGGLIQPSSPILESRLVAPSITRVTSTEREARAGHSGVVVWLTGLPGSGKSTLAEGLERVLFDRGMNVLVLDGDAMRFGVSADLGFSAADRSENIRRVAEMAKLFAESGAIVITAFISPYLADRARARAIAAAAGVTFLEVFVDADLATCEARDPKGLYRKARAGEIADFTGVSAPYEAPASPEGVIKSAGPLDACLRDLVELTVARLRPMP